MPKTPTLAHLISDKTHTTLYESLACVEQDEEWLTLAQHLQGLYSDGFASCFAIIIRNTNDPTKIALAHVSSIGFNVDRDIAFYKAMIQAVSVTGDDVTIELARSMQGYTTDYNYALIRLDDGTIFNRNPDNLEPTAFFAIEDKRYQQFFETHFGLTPPVREMQSGMIAINRHGEVDYLEPHMDGEITIDVLDTPRNKRRRSVTPSPSGLSFFGTESGYDADTEGSDEDISPKRQKTGGGY